MKVVDSQCERVHCCIVSPRVRSCVFLQFVITNRWMNAMLPVMYDTYHLGNGGLSLSIVMPSEICVGKSYLDKS
jgi:hypothetical protein